MNQEHVLWSKFRDRGRIEGGELLLRHVDALDFIEDCRDMGLVILGMDFYIESSNNVIETFGPADYSSASTRPDASERTVSAARRLIEEGLPDGADWVSFVLDGPTS